MSFDAEKRTSIKAYLLDKIRCDDDLFTKKTEYNFNISMTTIRRYIEQCRAENLIYKTSKAKCGYKLCVVENQLEFSFLTNLDEDYIYQKLLDPLLIDISTKTRHILRYAFTEIMNNAIEHSQGNKICCNIRKDCLYTEISIVDDGIGIYNSIIEYAKKELQIEIDTIYNGISI